MVHGFVQRISRGKAKLCLFLVGIFALSMFSFGATIKVRKQTIEADEFTSPLVSASWNEGYNLKAFEVKVPSGRSARVVFSRSRTTKQRAFNCSQYVAVYRLGDDTAYPLTKLQTLNPAVEFNISSTTTFLVVPNPTLEDVPTIVGYDKVLGMRIPQYRSLSASRWDMYVQFQVSVSYSGSGGSTPTSPSVSPETVSWELKPEGGTGNVSGQIFVKGVPSRIVPNPFVRNGYTFKGWSNSPNGACIFADQAEVTPTTSRTLYALWQKIVVNKVTVNFNANGGTGSMASQVFVSGTSQQLTRNRFVKSGYTFAGWSSSVSGDVAYTDGASVYFGKDQSGTRVFYARWTANAVNVLLKSNVGGSSWSKTLTGTVGATIGSLPTPSACVGYSFVGWYDASGNAVTASTRVPSQGMTLYAKWREDLKTVTVMLDANGGNAMTSSLLSYTIGGSRIVKFGTSLPVPTHPKYYFFDGWFTAASGGECVNADTLVNGSVTRLYAHWCKGLGMDPTGAYVIDPGGYALLNPVSFPLRMKGTLSEDSEAWIDGKGDCASLLFTAGTSQSCFVYLTSGNVTAEITDHTRGTSATCAGQKMEYYFRSGHDYSITVVYPGRRIRPVGDVERVSFELEITAGAPTLSYLDSPTGLTATTDSEYAVELSWDAVPGAEYYRVYASQATFDGSWKAGGEVTVDESAFVGVSYSTSYYDTTAAVGEWTYYFVVAANGKTTSSSIAANYVLGYCVADISAHTECAMPMPAKGGKGTVRFWSNCPLQATSDSEWLVLEDTTGEPTDTVLGSIAFTCAMTDVSSTREARVTLTGGPADNRIEEVVVIRQEGRGSGRTLHFDSGDGTAVSDKTVYDKLPLADLDAPQRTGYVFMGWTYKDQQSGLWWQVTNETTVADVITATGDTTVSAYWRSASWWIKFDANGGTGKMSNDIQSYGIVETLSTNRFVRTGYTFDGWSTTPNGDAEYFDGEELLNYSETDGAAYTFYAVWVPNCYEVVFSPNGADGEESSQLLTYDVADELLPCAYSSPNGILEFRGWALSPQGKVAYADCASVKNLASENGASIRLYAVWEDPPGTTYDITYKPGAYGQESEQTVSKVTGTALTLKGAIFTRASYVQTGWATTDGGALAYALGASYAANAAVTLYPVWKYSPTPVVYAKVGSGCSAMGSVTGGGKVLSSGATVTLKATANKGYVFAGWYQDAAFETPAEGSEDYRSPSFTVVVGSEETTLYARFIPAEDDYVEIDCPCGELRLGKDIILRISVVSGSLPNISVSGLPPGMKFTGKPMDMKLKQRKVVELWYVFLLEGKKWLIGERPDVTNTAQGLVEHYEANTLYGAPTRSGVYVVTVTAKTAGKATASTALKFIVRNEDEAIVDVEYDLNCGKVTGMGVCAAGKSLVLKATAGKGYVFAGWYHDAQFENPVTDLGVDCRSTSLPVVGNGRDKVYYACFAPMEEDCHLDVGVLDADEKPSITRRTPWPALRDEYMVTGACKLWVVVASCSAPTVTVKGLPTGLKFDAKSFLISGTPTKPGAYTVTLSLKNATVKTAKTQTFVINVANIESPYLDVNYATDAYVYHGGVAVGWDLASCATDGYSVSAVTGLPIGLKYNAKTGKIEGVPTKAGTYTATITLKRGSVKSSATVTLTVEAIPVWAYGTFNGGSDAGQAQLTISSAGKISGKFMSNGRTYALAANSFAAWDDGTYIAYATASYSYKDGTRTVKASEVWTIAVREGLAGGTLACTSDSDWMFEAYQSNWAKTDWKARGVSLFGKSGKTMTLTGSKYGLGDDESVTLTIKSTGAVAAKGKFDTEKVDRYGNAVSYSVSGTAVVSATEVDPFEGVIYLYFPPNESKGFAGYTCVVPVGE